MGGAVLQANSQPWQADRLNQVYVLGSIVALAVAATVVATNPKIGRGNVNYSPSSSPSTYANQGPGSGASSDEETAAAQQSPSPSTAAASGHTGAAGEAALPAPSRTIRTHLERLKEGDYEGAFALMDSEYRSANPGWVENRTQGDPEIDIVGVGSPHYGHRSALVYVKFYARDRIRFPGATRDAGSSRAWCGSSSEATRGAMNPAAAASPPQ